MQVFHINTGSTSSKREREVGEERKEIKQVRTQHREP